MPRPPKPPIDLSDIKNLPKVTIKLYTPPIVEDANVYWVAQYPGSNDPPGNIELARINVYCTDHWLYIIFQKEPLPPNFYSESGSIKVVCAFANINEYMHYVDMLRNEKPIQVTFNLGVTPPSIAVYPKENHSI